MVDETMLEEQLDMSLDELIAKGAKRTGNTGRGGRHSGGGRRGSSGRAPKKEGDVEAMDVDLLAPKKLTVTVANQLRKPQGGGVSKKKGPAPRVVPQLGGTAKAQPDDRPRPRIDLDAQTWTHDMFQDKGPAKPRLMTAAHRARARHDGAGAKRQQAPLRQEPAKMSKLMISNLADDVDNNDIKELFARIGPIKFAEITYDRTGRPTGMAEVVYETEADAQAAVDSYNGVALDGKKMMIKVVADKSAQSAQDGSFRLSSGRQVSNAFGGGADVPKTVPRGRGTTGRLKSTAHAFS